MLLILWFNNFLFHLLEIVFKKRFSIRIRFTSNVKYSNSLEQKRESAWFQKSLFFKEPTFINTKKEIKNTLRHLTILTGKDRCFTQFSRWMAGWLLFIFFVCLQNQLHYITFYTFHYLWVQMFEKCDSSNRQ